MQGIYLGISGQFVIHMGISRDSWRWVIEGIPTEFGVPRAGWSLFRLWFAVDT